MNEKWDRYYEVVGSGYSLERLPQVLLPLLPSSSSLAPFRLLSPELENGRGKTFMAGVDGEFAVVTTGHKSQHPYPAAAFEMPCYLPRPWGSLRVERCDLQRKVIIPIAATQDGRLATWYFALAMASGDLFIPIDDIWGVTVRKEGLSISGRKRMTVVGELTSPIGNWAVDIVVPGKPCPHRGLQITIDPQKDPSWIVRTF